MLFNLGTGFVLQGEGRLLRRSLVLIEPKQNLNELVKY